MAVLEQALKMAQRKGISTIVVASTSGDTALKLFELIGAGKIKMIVVTHDEGRPLKWRRFSEAVRRRLLANNVAVYTHNPGCMLLRKIAGGILRKIGFSPRHTRLMEIEEKYGTGIKVCNIIVRMSIEGGILKGEKVVAIAGREKGADSAAVFSIRPEDKWPVLEEIIATSGS